MRGRECVCSRRRLRTELVDEPADHPHGAAPRGVRRTDRFDDVLEDGRTAKHPAGAERGPREQLVAACDGIERREILVEPKHPAQLGEEVRAAPLAD